MTIKIDIDAPKNSLAPMTLLEGLARGEKAVKDGRVLTHVQAQRRMAHWLKNS
ncbi:MAG TPA: hypothetical protein VNF99_13865 [Stellaceae bacterium]|nr:hypothetical protein [Stellaceae bacterium]